MNIPSNDPGVKLVPFIQTFCEWLVRLAGSIATCVESSEMVVDHIATHGRIPVSSAEDITLSDDLINRGQASPNGATNSDAASAQMTRLGIPNAHMHQSGSSFDWIGQIKAGIDRGVASLYGFNQAHLTHDDWTNTNTNQGVFGHGVAIVGYDSTGAIVADPNTVQAENGDFVHYTWANLLAAASGNPDVITPEASMGTPLDSDFNITNGVYTLKTDNKVNLSGGEATLFVQLGGASGLPRMEDQEGYTLQAKFKDPKIYFRRYERMVFLYDPNHVKDRVPGFGDWMPGHVDDPDFGIVAPSDDEAAEAASEAALTAQVSQLTAEVASLKAAKPAYDPSIVSALTSASQVLSPLGAVASEVAAALKVVNG